MIGVARAISYLTSLITALQKVPQTTPAIFLPQYSFALRCLYDCVPIQFLNSIAHVRELFRKAAMHIRGVVGWVEREGYIAQGDTALLLLPKVTYSY